MANEEPNVPFGARIGVTRHKYIDNDFPESAKSGLIHLIADLIDEDKLKGWDKMAREARRINRRSRYFSEPEEVFAKEVYSMKWYDVFHFCERIYLKYAKAICEYDINGNLQEEISSISDARMELEQEINLLMDEESIIYKMDKGLFANPGGSHYQKTMSKSRLILADPRLIETRQHFIKARKYFESLDNKDYENSIKESVSAIESAGNELYGWKGGDLIKSLKNHKFQNSPKIPHTIIKAIDGVYSFRGAGAGVSHGGANGGSVTPEITEWVLVFSASTITMLRSLNMKEDESVEEF